MHCVLHACASGATSCANCINPLLHSEGILNQSCRQAFRLAHYFADGIPELLAVSTPVPRKIVCECLDVKYILLSVKTSRSVPKLDS